MRAPHTLPAPVSFLISPQACGPDRRGRSEQLTGPLTLCYVSSSLSRLLGQVDTGGLNNYMATISRDGRWVAAGTFTSDVKVGRVWGFKTMHMLFGMCMHHVCLPTSPRCALCTLLQVYEVQFDRLGAFTGVKMAMSLKGHKSKVGGWVGLRAWALGAVRCCCCLYAAVAMSLKGQPFKVGGAVGGCFPLLLRAAALAWHPFSTIHLQHNRPNESRCSAWTSPLTSPRWSPPAATACSRCLNPLQLFHNLCPCGLQLRARSFC